ncbi:entericidin [Glaciimonas sp. PCH181]|nr:entericidin A/B family lipoprotein [Glaciimonas sp. PCH181]PUA18293.1 entericidin [Glaciimonas sp. PCH181]
MKKIISIAAVISMFGILSACNTFEGMGKDVQKGGEKVQDAAQDTKAKM